MFVDGDNGIRSGVGDDPRDLIKVIRWILKIVPAGLSNVMIES